MKYKNEDLYYYVNNVLNIIKEGLLEKKFRIDSFEDSVVVERLLQKMCGLVIPELGIKAQKEIQNGIKPFSEFNGTIELGNFGINFERKKLSFGPYLVVKLGLSFIYKYLRSLRLFIVYGFKNKKSGQTKSIFLDNNFIHCKNEKEYLEIKKKIRLSELDCLKENLLIQGEVNFDIYTPSKVEYSKNPLFQMLYARDIRNLDIVGLFFAYLLFPFRVSVLIFRNPILLLISNDFILLPIVLFLNQKRKLQSFIYTTTDIGYQPLWIRSFRNRKFTTHFLNYSCNSHDFRHNSLNRVDFYPLIGFIFADVNWVWVESQKKMYQHMGLKSIFKVVGPILEGLNNINLSYKSKKKNLRVALFDVPVFKEEFIQKLGTLDYYYKSSNMLKFYTTILRVCQELEKLLSVNIKIVLKPKRRTHPLYDESHLIQLSKLTKANKNFVILDYDYDLNKLVLQSCCCVSIPYTGTAIIASKLGISSCYYDPLSSLFKPRFYESGLNYIYDEIGLSNFIRDAISKFSVNLDIKNNNYD